MTTFKYPIMGDFKYPITGHIILEGRCTPLFATGSAYMASIALEALSNKNPDKEYTLLTADSQLCIGRKPETKSETEGEQDNGK